MELIFSCFVMSTPPLLFLPFYLPLRVAAASTTAKRGLFLTDSLTDRRAAAYFCLLLVRPSMRARD